MTTRQQELALAQRVQRLVADPRMTGALLGAGVAIAAILDAEMRDEVTLGSIQDLALGPHRTTGGPVTVPGWSEQDLTAWYTERHLDPIQELATPRHSVISRGAERHPFADAAGRRSVRALLVDDQGSLSRSTSTAAGTWSSTRSAGTPDPNTYNINRGQLHRETPTRGGWELLPADEVERNSRRRCRVLRGRVRCGCGWRRPDGTRHARLRG